MHNKSVPTSAVGRPISDTDSIIVQPPAKGHFDAAAKAWVKAAYLAAGSATKGAAWRERWAREVRKHIVDPDTREPLPSVVRVDDLRRHERVQPSMIETRRLFRSEPGGYIMCWDGILVSLGVTFHPDTMTDWRVRASVIGSVRLPAYFGEDRWPKD